MVSRLKSNITSHQKLSSDFWKFWVGQAISTLGSSLLLEGSLTITLSLTHAYWLVLLLWMMRGGIDVLFTINAYSLTQSLPPCKAERHQGW